MRKLLAPLVLAAIALNASSAEYKPPRRSLSFTSSFVLIPVMANVPGLFGAVWKTKAALLNPTAFSYPIQVTLYDKTGKVKETTINMSSGQVRDYEHFLSDVFSYGRAGTVKLDSQSIPGWSDSN